MSWLLDGVPRDERVDAINAEHKATFAELAERHGGLVLIPREERDAVHEATRRAFCHLAGVPVGDELISKARRRRAPVVMSAKPPAPRGGARSIKAPPVSIAQGPITAEKLSSFLTKFTGA